ncbi:uncharacterized protein STEHIDRAFT_162378 [Stereum hirsutum FP-91666 SS1]|uniref:uncharacterized protein n=1 Tax=Stereum hirsutum (strain FP-91666) TaxID=721885 RepID=UPI000444A6A9|nr:uncharacterized protein STEHIDRAFT_162378 [Stereum hirsutum FP-91666 SS1]EIM80596.1 hypothetical protein STEHIDRAFT_162378 [Stereum hirsutum FP-91666 SS1]
MSCGIYKLPGYQEHHHGGVTQAGAASIAAALRSPSSLPSSTLAATVHNGLRHQTLKSNDHHLQQRHHVYHHPINSLLLTRCPSRHSLPTATAVMDHRRVKTFSTSMLEGLCAGSWGLWAGAPSARVPVLGLESLAGLEVLGLEFYARVSVLDLGSLGWRRPCRGPGALLPQSPILWGKPTDATNSLFTGVGIVVVNQATPGKASTLSWSRGSSTSESDPLREANRRLLTVLLQMCECDCEQPDLKYKTLDALITDIIVANQATTFLKSLKTPLG